MALEFSDGNAVRLLECGAAYFPALEADIHAAQEEIYLETYIYADDCSGQRITAALAAAVARGVRVHVLIDGRNLTRFHHTLPRSLAVAGIPYAVYRPEAGRVLLHRARLRRLHRKLAVLDGRVAFIGGLNIIDDMNTPGQRPPRLDYGARVEGPLASRVRREADALWRLVRLSNLRHWERARPLAAPVPRAGGKQRVALVLRDNFRHRDDIERAYLEALAGARSEILLCMAYFLPGRRIRRALMEAAARGVAVRLLLQARVEFIFVHYATRALYGSLLDAGVQIYEFLPSALHAKIAVVDGRWATVGSSNIDPLSLLFAREANIVVDDLAFADEVRSSLQRHIKHHARQVSPAHWKEQPLHQRLLCWLALGITRLLTGWFGYADHH